MQLGYSKMVGDMTTAKQKLQKEAFEFHEIVRAATKFVPSESVAVAIATEMSIKFMEYVGDEWWQLVFLMIAKYSNGLVTTGEGPGERKAPGYPDWWLQSVGYTEWPPSNPSTQPINPPVA
mmetsp:Transcript_12384/g.28187  ORF Transcript_12384/g.28187 Transcript_12384/m.28187 type:complete len:121 (-) Transcript_12384:611-973(-)